jgi:hypothetical protein
VLSLEPRYGGIQIGRRDDHMIDPHRSAQPTRGTTPNRGHTDQASH